MTRLALALAIFALLACAVGFAATAALLRHRNREKERAWREREERWEVPLLDVFAGAKRPVELWSLVAAGEELYFIDYLLRFARRTRGGTRHVLEELARPYLAPIVARMRGGDPERRARAVETVAMLGFGPYGRGVIEALSDPSPLVAMVAARNVARQGRPEHAELVLDHASRVSHWSPRQLTAVLVSMGAPAAPGLRRVLTNDSDPPGVRALASDALRLLHDPAAVAAAESVLCPGQDRELLVAALRLIAELGGPAEAARARSFTSDADPVVRSAAVQALAMAGTPEDIDLLRESLSDESGWVGLRAARALKLSGAGATLREIARGQDTQAKLAQHILVESG